MRQSSPEGKPVRDYSWLRAKTNQVHRALVEVYGLPVNTQPSDPTEELVRTMLSQNTNDINRDRGFTRLLAHFPNWQAVAEAQVEDLADAIRPSGLADTKAPRIQEALRAIEKRSGSYDLSFICDMEIEEANAWLTSIHGVGPKTAACVLLFSCQKPVMPVDTHVLRLSTRLGLLPENTSPEKAHIELRQIISEELVYPLHINLIRHGRAICHASSPEHESCNLRDLCEFYSKQGEKQPKYRLDKAGSSK